MTGPWRTLAAIAAVALLAVSIAAALACDAGFLLLPGIVLALGLLLLWRRNLGGPIILLIVALPLLPVSINGLMANGVSFDGDTCRSGDSLFYLLAPPAALVLLISSIALIALRKRTLST